jgi:hypothetical protein
MYCLGEKRVTNDDVVRTVVNWLKNNPTQLKRSAGTAVVFAMREAYPCAAPDGKE